jgi:hypothetical protein
MNLAMRHAGILVPFLASLASAVAAEPPPVEDYLHRNEAGWREIAAAEPGAPRITACDDQAQASFDIPLLARAVAGDFIWLKLGDEGHARFTAVLRERLARDCARRGGPGTLTLLRTRQRPDGVSVTTRLTGSDITERTLVWRLRPGGPWGWQASDVSADGVSLSSALHEQVRAAFDTAEGDAEAAIVGLANGAPLP